MSKNNEARKSTRNRVAKRFYDDKPSSSKSTDTILKKKAHVMYDTGTISLLTLKTMKSDWISMFNSQVDFRNCSMNVIDKLFPKKQFCGNLEPPLSRRISGMYITDFRCLSKKDKNMISYDTVDGMPIS